MHPKTLCTQVTKILHSSLLACNIYVSEGRDENILNFLAAAAKSTPMTALVHTFHDNSYNRTGYTLVGTSINLRAGVLSLAEAALEKIDMRQQAGLHPRLGAVDHICFHPLGDVHMEEAGAAARHLAKDLAASRSIPVFVYGFADSNRRHLADLRRALGYFRATAGEQWQGEHSLSGNQVADFGPSENDPRGGAVIVGATPWVINYNVPLQTENLSVARSVARAVSSRGGGLPGVEAMALFHDSGIIEVACNLLDENLTTPDDVQQQVNVLCGQLGIVAKQGYFPGLRPSTVMAKALAILSTS